MRIIFILSAAILLLISCKEQNKEYLEDLLINPSLESQIFAPASGSAFYIGTYVNIRWSVNDDSYNISLVLLKGSEKITIAENIPNSGNYLWNVNQSLVSGDDYKIAIYRTSDNKLIGKMDGPFSLQKHPLLLTQPNGGNTWYTGRTYDIKWDQNLTGSNNVNIELWENNSFHSTIVTNRAATYEFYQWQIPKDLPQSLSYKIKVISTSNPSVYDYSDDLISIKTAEFKIQFPINNVTLFKGYEYPIFWSKPDGYSNLFTIDLYKSGVKISTLKSNFTSQYGAITFTVGTTLADGPDYSIRITNNSTSALISSDNFSITSGTYNNGNTNSYEPNNIQENSYGPLLPNSIYTSYLNSSTDRDWFNIIVPDFNYLKFFISNNGSMNFGFKFMLSTGLSSYYTDFNTFHLMGGNYKIEISSSSGAASLTVPYYFIYVYD